jgi:uncharacterized protein YgiM (DUF1202 family)
MRILKNFTAGSAAVAVSLAALAGAAAPTAASAQVGRNIVNCDAPGGRQVTGAAIGAVLGGVLGSQVAKNERTLGTVAGAGLGAAAGSYVGCKQQRDRAVAYQSAYGQGYAAANTYVARTNLKVRSAPSTRAAQVGSLGAGQPFQVAGMQNGWVRLANGGWVSGAYVSPAG